MRLTMRVFCCLLLSMAGATAAQTAEVPGSRNPSGGQGGPSPIPVITPGSAPVGGGGMGFYGGYFSGAGSTAEGSMMSGMADVIRSSGYANLQNSAAAINYEQARRSDMENNWIAAEGYFQGRQMNKNYRQAEASPRASKEDLARYAKQSVPKRLSPSELDPLTGQVAWPALLRTTTFQTERRKLDAMFAARARLGQLTADQQAVMEQTAEELEATLKKHISSVKPQDYVSAKKFLEQVTYEIGQPAT